MDAKEKPFTYIVRLYNEYGDILQEYSEWLERNGYLDMDWRQEADNETSVSDFLIEKYKNETR